MKWDIDTNNNFDDYFVMRQRVTYTHTNTIILETEAWVYVQFNNPCFDQNIINSQTISDIDYWIKDGTFNRVVPYFSDVPTQWYSSNVAGNTDLFTNPADICGTKSYAIYESDQTTPNTKTAYMNLVNTGAQLEIHVYTTLPEYYTNADVTYYLKVSLDDYVVDYEKYGHVVYYNQFKVNMKNCQVTGFNKDNDQTYNYILYTPVIKKPYTAFTDIAQAGTIRTGSNCGYTVNYKVEWETYWGTRITIPTFIEWYEGSTTFWIQSDDTIDLTDERQTYTIVLTGSIDITDMNPIFEDEYKFTLTVVNDCTTDVMTKMDSNSFYPGHSSYSYPTFTGTLTG